MGEIGESKRHFRAAIKELLLALRSLTDACVERLEKKTQEEGEEAEQARPPTEEREKE